MAAPNPFANDPIQNFTDADWKEAIANYDPSGGSNWGDEGGGETSIEVTKIPFNAQQAFARYCLGWQGVSDGSANGLVLQRSLPQRHPLWRELIAKFVTLNPYKPDGRPSTPGVKSWAGLKRYVPGSSTIPSPPAYAGYISAKAHVGFVDPEYAIHDDFAMGSSFLYAQPADTVFGTPAYQFPGEWNRFTVFGPAPKVEALSIDGYTLSYAEGSGNTDPPTSNPKGKKVLAPAGQLLVKADLSLTTYKLPEEFLFGPGDLLPRNIISCLGKVNRYPLFNRPAGTLVYLGCELSKRRFSLRVPDGTVTPNETRFLWAAHHLFGFFDPPKGYSDNTSQPLQNLRGHNCLFWIGSLNTETGEPVPGDRNAMKWFYATGSGSPTDPGLLPTIDLAQLWRPVCNTKGVFNPFYDIGTDPHIPN